MAADGVIAPEAAAATEEKTAEAKPAEPEMIDVWRPAGRAEKRPPRVRRPQRPQQAPALTATPAGDGATTTDGATPAAAKPEAPRGDRKDGPTRDQRQERHERQQRMERQAKGFEKKTFGQPGGRPPGGGPPRGDRPRRDKGSQVERAEREQYYAKPHGSAGGSDRNKAPDPNSPFAKLAALKQQLEQGNKP